MDAVAIAEVLGRAARHLKARGVEAAQREARLLLAHASGLSAAHLMAYPERTIPVEILAAYERLLDRRSRREPLSRILGEREFWSLRFRVIPDTLDPRPDSETLVAAALAHGGARDGARRIVDFGTGTGCLLLALLSEWPNAIGVGIDRSEAAAMVAADNARSLGLADRAFFMVGDWATALIGPVDVIIANPPYIPAGAIAGLAPEVREHDPIGALVGGLDGLDAYRTLIPQAAGRVASGGLVLLEIGQGQGDAVHALGTAAGLTLIERRLDLAGIERVLVLQKAG